MTKSEFVAELAASCELTKKKAEEVVDEVFGLMKSHLIEDGEFKLHGFGQFNVKERAARKGRNPQTGEEITIPAKKVVSFKAASALGAEVNA